MVIYYKTMVYSMDYKKTLCFTIKQSVPLKNIDYTN